MNTRSKTFHPAFTTLTLALAFALPVHADERESLESLRQTTQALIDAGVLPYYLHLLDRVAGTAHFDVDDARGRSLVQEMRERLPGYLVPQLVREVPGAASKTPA